jgi:hypothetical protein
MHQKIYSKTKNYSIVRPFSYFFFTLGLSHDVKIVVANIELQRTILEAVPRKT